MRVKLIGVSNAPRKPNPLPGEARSMDDVSSSVPADFRGHSDLQRQGVPEKFLSNLKKALQ